MGYLGRRIGLSQNQGDSNPGAAGGAVGGGLLDLFTHGYFEKQGDLYNAPGSSALVGLTATGGAISDYISGADVYRAHVFTSSGTFDVSALTENIPSGNTVEYLVVAGGGGGGGSFGGAGGAGGLRTNLTGHPLTGATFPVSVSSYTVTVGAGGAGNPDRSRGAKGVDSVFGSITSTGGGFGGGNDSGVHPGGPGGSGGSGGLSGGVGPPGSGNDPPVSPSQGNNAGTGIDAGTYAANCTGGGGGAGAVGTNASSPGVGGAGGAGVQVAIAGPAADTTGVGAINPGPGQYQWFAGGGGGHSGEVSGRTRSSGGVGGGGQGGISNGAVLGPRVGLPAQYATGGGGGASCLLYTSPSPRD